MVAPTLADLEQTPTDDAAPDTAGGQGETIANITKIGTTLLVTFTDGREVELKPGDQITLGPISRDTTVDLGDGQGPVNLRDLHHAGKLPASLHGMIPPQPEPTAADAGLAVPQLADMGGAPPDAGAMPPDAGALAATAQPPPGKPMLADL